MIRKILLLLCFIAFPLFAGSRAEWIVYPETDDASRNNERYFRKEFTVPSGKTIQSAYIFYRIVNSGTVRVNGTAVQTSTQLTLYPNLGGQFDVTNFVASGNNAISAATKYTGTNNLRGLIVRLLITYTDGSIQEVVTDATWKTSTTKTTGWENVGYADQGWQAARSVGDCAATPWLSAGLDMDAFYPESEERFSVDDLEDVPEEDVEIVYQKGGAFFKIGDTLYPPVLFNYCDGTFINYTNPDFTAAVTAHVNAGIKLISGGFDLETNSYNGKKFWAGPNTYNYEVLDEALKRMFTLAPEGRFIFSLTFSHGPQWWNQKYPEDAIQYARIDDHYSSSDCIGNYPCHSFGSERWRHDACEAIKKLVQHVESTPYGKRIIGYRIGEGVYGEWIHFGMAGAMPDVSPAMVTFFRNFLRDKYDGDVSKLRDSWNQPEVTFDTAMIPPVDVRLQCLEGTLSGTPLRDPRNHWLLDYLKCMQYAIRDLLLSMDKAAKEGCNNKKLVGNYCGYFYNQGYTTDGWQIETDDILDSPYVDFLVAPTCYSSLFRNVGRSQLARELAASFPLHNTPTQKKLCIIEADTRTHLTAAGYDSKTAETVEDSLALLSRDLAQAISRGCAYWYYDLAKGTWYNCPEILNFFQKIVPIYNAIPDFSSSAGIAVIADWESVYYHAVQELRKHPDYQYTTVNGGRPAHAAINYVALEMTRAGLVFDSYSFEDIGNDALDQYKIYIFPQLFYMTPEKLAKLNTLKKAGKTLIFLNLPGYLTPSGPDVNSIYQTTGIQVQLLNQKIKGRVKLKNGTEMDRSEYSLDMYINPMLKVNDSGATILGSLTYGGTTENTYAKKVIPNGPTIYINGFPFISSAELKRIAQEAGVHSYCDSENGVVYANKSMISFHTATAGTYTLKAPSAVKWTKVYPQTAAETGAQTSITFTTTGPDTVIYVIKP